MPGIRLLFGVPVMELYKKEHLCYTVDNYKR